jgi:alkanesulfonate monooxygenase SsuD/methylene tetrahydromethanopterin reductase-like flavin-dependent oxidoreductase (luciferase family)
MKRSIVFAGTDAIATIVELAREAEAAGFDRVWTTENHSRDGILRATAIALSTTRIGVGTGIAYAFTRAPLSMATLAAELRVLSGGRFTLGLGAMTRGMRRNWYGIEIDHPASRFREYVQLLRTAFNTTTGLKFSGRYYSADVPAFDLSGDRQLIQSTPIYGSGVNAAMLKACADVCDGIALHSIASGLPYYDSAVTPALQRSGRSVRMAVWRITSIHHDRERARAAARKHIAFYLTTPSYRGVGEGRTWAPRVDAIQSAFRASLQTPDWRTIGALVSDDMVEELALAGTPSEVRDQASAQIDEYAQRGVDELVYQTTSTDMTALEMRDNQKLLIDTLGSLRAPTHAGA